MGPEPSQVSVVQKVEMVTERRGLTAQNRGLRALQAAYLHL